MEAMLWTLAMFSRNACFTSSLSDFLAWMFMMLAMS